MYFSCNCASVCACVQVRRNTFCCAIQPIASWKLRPPSSQLPLVLLLLRRDPVMALWTPCSWSLHISILSVNTQHHLSGFPAHFGVVSFHLACRICLELRFHMSKTSTYCP